MITITNLQRLQMETKGIDLPQDELSIYLQENDLNPHDEYNAQSATNKRSIYSAAISVLESLANNPTAMKSYKLDDMSVTQFHENLLARIEQMERKLRTLKTDKQKDSNIFMLFR